MITKFSNNIFHKLSTRMLCFLYGPFSALVYLFLKIKAVDNGLHSFCYVCCLVSLFFFIFSRKSFLSGITNLKILFRGAFYGFTQILLITALKECNTSTMLMASTFGTVVAIIAGIFILKEQINISIGIALTCTVVVGIINFTSNNFSLYAVCGGVCQGLNIVLSRYLLVSNRKMTEILGSSVFSAAVTTLIYILLFTNEPIKDTIIPSNILFLGISLILIQYYQLFVIKLTNSQMASVYGLTRIPFSFIIELIISSKIPIAKDIFSGSIIMVSGILVFLKKKKSTSHPAKKN